MQSLSACLLIVLLHYTQAQNANCDFSQYVEAGKVYYVQSPGYSRNYTPGVQCRWRATCPAGYNCVLNCTDINLPQSSSCALDRLLISKSGDPLLIGANYYCGKGSLVAVSTEQSLSVGLITARTSPGGRVSCQLSTQPAALASTTCKCGYKKLNRIVGGQSTKINEYPMMAGVLDVNIGQIKCGAVIIDQRYVLTAARCVTGMNTSSLVVVVGEHDVSTTDETSATRVYKVRDIIIHGKYKQSDDDYDIALLRLSTSIEFSDRVGPVCLPFKFATNNFDGSKVTILGWGTLFSGGPTSAVLQKVDVDVISSQSCSNRVAKRITARQLCTYTAGKDACQDDTGGPLLFTDPATGLSFTVGVLSNGASCASRVPYINTRVTAFLDWILLKAPSNYCVK